MKYKKGGLTMRTKLLLLMIIPGLLILAGIAWAVSQGNENATPEQKGTTTGLPRLLDLGADKCVPCKMMAPVLDELKREFDGRLQVDFIDVWKKPDEAPKYQINTIPTQIFFDAQGKELWRHVGFISKQDILDKWAELGYSFQVTGLSQIEEGAPK
jgi:thioredoxin 1